MMIWCTPAVPSKNEPVAVAADPIRMTFHVLQWRYKVNPMTLQISLITNCTWKELIHIPENEITLSIVQIHGAWVKFYLFTQVILYKLWCLILPGVFTAFEVGKHYKICVIKYVSAMQKLAVLCVAVLGLFSKASGGQNLPIMAGSFLH